MSHTYGFVAHHGADNGRSMQIERIRTFVLIIASALLLCGCSSVSRSEDLVSAQLLETQERLAIAHARARQEDRVELEKYSLGTIDASPESTIFFFVRWDLLTDGWPGHFWVTVDESGAARLSKGR